MSLRPSATAIGAFVIGTLVLVVGSLAFFGSNLFGSGKDLRSAVVIFTGSVKGLNVGAPVTLRGVKIGDVREIALRYDETHQEFVTPVFVTVNVADLGVKRDFARTAALAPLVERGLRAQLRMQSVLTGLLYIDLDFLPQSQARYVDYDAGAEQIPTAPTELEAILERVSEIDIQAFVQRADNTVRALESLLTDPEVKRLPASLNATLAEVRTLAADTDREVKALGGRVGGLVDTAEGELSGTGVELKRMADRLDTSLVQLDATLVSLQRTSDEVGYAASDRSPALHELGEAAAEIGRAARAMQALADTLAQEPESIIRGRSAGKEETP